MNGEILRWNQRGRFFAGQSGRAEHSLTILFNQTYCIKNLVEPLPVNGSLASPSFIWNSPGMGYQFQFVGNKSAIQMMEAGQIKLLIIKFGK